MVLRIYVTHFREYKEKSFHAINVLIFVSTYVCCILMKKQVSYKRIKLRKNHFYIKNQYQIVLLQLYQKIVIRFRCKNNQFFHTTSKMNENKRRNIRKLFTRYWKTFYQYSTIKLFIELHIHRFVIHQVIWIYLQYLRLRSIQL